MHLLRRALWQAEEKRKGDGFVCGTKIDLPPFPAPARAWSKLAKLLAPVPEEVAVDSAEEWTAVVWLAEHQRLMPLLYHCLKVSGRLGQLPEELRERLKLANYEALARYSMMAKIVVPEVLAIAEAVDLVVLRGPTLAHAIYDAPHLRESGDIDLLIRPRDMQMAGRVLSKRGFECVFSSKLEQNWVRQERARGGDVACFFELHTHIGAAHRVPAPPASQVWASVRPARIWGEELNMLSLEITALEQCVQYVRSLWAGRYQLRQVIDLAYIFAHASCDAKRLREMATECGASGILACAAVLSGVAEPVSFPHAGAQRAFRRLQRYSDMLLVGTTSTWRRRMTGLLGLLMFDRATDRYRHFVSRLIGSLASHLRRR